MALIRGQGRERRQWKLQKEKEVLCECMCVHISGCVSNGQRAASKNVVTVDEPTHTSVDVA